MSKDVNLYNKIATFSKRFHRPSVFGSNLLFLPTLWRDPLAVRFTRLGNHPYTLKQLWQSAASWLKTLYTSLEITQSTKFGSYDNLSEQYQQEAKRGLAGTALSFYTPVVRPVFSTLQKTVTSPNLPLITTTVQPYTNQSLRQVKLFRNHPEKANRIQKKSPAKKGWLLTKWSPTGFFGNNTDYSNEFKPSSNPFGQALLSLPTALEQSKKVNILNRIESLRPDQGKDSFSGGLKEGSSLPRETLKTPRLALLFGPKITLNGRIELQANNASSVLISYPPARPVVPSQNLSSLNESQPLPRFQSLSFKERLAQKGWNAHTTLFIIYPAPNQTKPLFGYRGLLGQKAYSAEKLAPTKTHLQEHSAPALAASIRPSQYRDPQPQLILNPKASWTKLYAPLLTTFQAPQALAPLVAESFPLPPIAKNAIFRQPTEVFTNRLQNRFIISANPTPYNSKKARRASVINLTTPDISLLHAQFPQNVVPSANLAVTNSPPYLNGLTGGQDTSRTEMPVFNRISATKPKPDRKQAVLRSFSERFLSLPKRFVRGLRVEVKPPASYKKQLANVFSLEAVTKPSGNVGNSDPFINAKRFEVLRGPSSSNSLLYNEPGAGQSNLQNLVLGPSFTPLAGLEDKQLNNYPSSLFPSPLSGNSYPVWYRQKAFTQVGFSKGLSVPSQIKGLRPEPFTVNTRDNQNLLKNWEGQGSSVVYPKSGPRNIDVHVSGYTSSPPTLKTAQLPVASIRRVSDANPPVSEVGKADLEQLAEKVYTRLRQRLWQERQRAGKW